LKPTNHIGSCIVATRIHTNSGTARPSLEFLENWCKRALNYADHLIIATDKVLLDGVRELVQTLDMHIYPLLVSPWRGVAVPLNAIIAEATLLGGKSLLLQSAEVQTDADNIRLLHEELDDNTLVVGAKLLDTHGQVLGCQPINGMNAPWNTLALWDLGKLNITGFLGISNGFINDIPTGMEEVSTICLLQHLYPKTTQAKLIQLPHYLDWDWMWDCPKRHHYHQQKISSKLARSLIQLKHLPFPKGNVIVS
jgi:hypothetical protein